MTVVLDTFPNEDSVPHSAAETRYRQARAGLERAQAERTQAVCHFLSAQAQWKISASHDPCGEDLLLGQTDQPLVQAEEQVRQAKLLYGAALEQQCLFQQLLSLLHDTYQTAQENRDRLALDAHNHDRTDTSFVLTRECDSQFINEVPPLCPPSPRFLQE